MPYAWPRDYELTCDNDIVAIGHYDSCLIVGTTGRPVMITGIDPQNMSQAELPIIEACVSCSLYGEYGTYAIYDLCLMALVMASGGDAQLITGGIITNRSGQIISLILSMRINIEANTSSFGRRMQPTKAV